MSNHNYPGMPAPYPSAQQNGQVVYDQTYPLQGNYGAPNSPQKCRVEVSFPQNGQPGMGAQNYGAPHYGYNQQRPMHNGFGLPGLAPARPFGSVQQYGNPTEVRVSSPTFADDLANALRNASRGHEIIIVLDAANIARQVANYVAEQAGSIASIIARNAREAIGLSHHNGYGNPVLVGAAIAALLLLGLGLIYAIVRVHDANKAAEIERLAIERGCRLVDVSLNSSGSGDSDDGWFSFLNGSRHHIVCDN